MDAKSAKEFLRYEPPDGTSSVHDHLVAVLQKLIVERPADANALFEEISASVRVSASKAPPRVPEDDELSAKIEKLTPKAAGQLEWTGEQKDFFVPPIANVQEGTSFPDLAAEARLWEWAGISFGDTETYRLGTSLKFLAMEQCLRLRFWGKFVTRDGDYYVAESLTKTEDNPAPTPEDRRKCEGIEGPNKYSYWVSKCPGPASSWTQLPHVTPEQLMVARLVKRFLTGDLNAPVACFPPFPGDAAPADENSTGFRSQQRFEAGTEAHYVRALVSLISCDTVLSLKGQLEPGEGVGDLEGVPTIQYPEEPSDPLDAEGLADVENWVHAELDINSLGRCHKPPEKEDDEGEAAEEEVEFPEPKEPLSSISGDTYTIMGGADGTEEITKKFWQEPSEGKVRACPKGSTAPQFSVFVAKSLKWPGAISAAKVGSGLSGPAISNVYVGFGVPSATTTFTPRQPGRIMTEWAPEEGEEEGADDDPTTSFPGKEKADVLINPEIANAEEDEE